MLGYFQEETNTFLTPLYVPEVIHLCKLTQFALFQILFGRKLCICWKSFRVVWRRRVAPPRKPFSYDNRTGLHLNSKSLRCNLEMGFSLKNSAYWLWCVWRCGENIKWNLYHRSQQLQKIQSLMNIEHAFSYLGGFVNLLSGIMRIYRIVGDCSLKKWLKKCCIWGVSKEVGARN